MSHRKKLFISLGFAFLACFGMWSLMDNQKKKWETQTTTVPVLRTKKYIKIGQEIKPRHIDVSSVPEAFREPKALTSLTELIDKDGKPIYRARMGLSKGQQLTGPGIVHNSVPLGLAWTLQRDYTALTLLLRPEQAVGGWLDPGDWVHLFIVVDRQQDWPKPLSKVLLDRVQVLAVGDKRWDPGTPLMSKDTAKALVNEDIMVTIRITVINAAKVLLAQEKGDIWLALMSPLKKEGEPSIAATLDRLR